MPVVPLCPTSREQRAEKRALHIALHILHIGCKLGRAPLLSLVLLSQAIYCTKWVHPTRTLQSLCNHKEKVLDAACTHTSAARLPLRVEVEQTKQITTHHFTCGLGSHLVSLHVLKRPYTSSVVRQYPLEGPGLWDEVIERIQQKHTTLCCKTNERDDSLHACMLACSLHNGSVTTLGLSVAIV